MRLFKSSVQITIHRGALEAIYDECDRYDREETGGRLIGTYTTAKRGRLSMTVSGVIEPGPAASRSAASFFQDGDYQERVFRSLEEKHPEIEHLGNWHTHHVNGYPTLSGGDRETYHRIVNHERHNTDFFYALLVTAKNDVRDRERYTVKHFVLFRGVRGELEVPTSHVRIVDRPILWPLAGQKQSADAPRESGISRKASDQRAQDSEFFKELFPGLQAMMSRKTGRVYWRGSIVLADETPVEIVAAEVEENGGVLYGIAAAGESPALAETSRSFADKRFGSAREAVVLFERALNREVLRSTSRKEHGAPMAPEDR